jgi:hypothetical protein
MQVELDGADRQAHPCPDNKKQPHAPTHETPHAHARLDGEWPAAGHEGAIGLSEEYDAGEIGQRRQGALHNLFAYGLFQ